MSNRIAFCTIATPGYLPMAAVLIDSIKAHYGDACDIHLLTVSWDSVNFRYPGVEVAHFDDIPNPYYWDMALRYDIVERASAYKPLLLGHVNRERRYDTVFYLDVDMQLFGRLDEASDLLHMSGASIVLSPHGLTPRGLGRPVDDRGILLSGTFNSGLLLIDASEEAFRFLHWWAMLNRSECVIDNTCFSFSRDQKWLALVPAYFERVQILRHPGYNVAHFNIDERGHVFTDGSLRLFHYTYVHQLGWDAARYIDAFALKPNEALSGLIERYIASVGAKRDELAAQSAMLVTNDADAAQDFAAAMRSAYRAAFPMPRVVDRAEFEERAARFREAASDQAPYRSLSNA